MPRFRLPALPSTRDSHEERWADESPSGDRPLDLPVSNDRLFDEPSIDDELDSLYDRFEPVRDRRRRRPDRADPPRLVGEGVSGRTLVETDTATSSHAPGASSATAETAPQEVDGRSPAIDDAPYSSYDVATHGPKPVPEWLVTALSARDTRLGTLKSGKEADVSLLDRSLPGGPGCLLAVKTYRSADHRLFHRDAGYTEGRRIRRSRETRAMATRTAFGRELLAGQWATAEFNALSDLWQAGVPVPYPVQIIGSELMMQFIGGPDGEAAPRLAAYDGSTAEFTELWHDLVASLEALADTGLTHGDLSPYNVLVSEDRCVLIDLPQVVDVVANPQGEWFLQRDCAVIAQHFARRGVLAADGELLAMHLLGIARS